MEQMTHQDHTLRGGSESKPIKAQCERLPGAWRMFVAVDILSGT
jgi:hypothetical protein